MSLQIPRLSAHSLKQHQLCPRKFALAYKAGRFWPASDRHPEPPDGLDPLALGSAFHQLVQWHQMGLEVDHCLAAWSEAMPPLEGLWQAFLGSPYARIGENERIFTEQTLSFFLAGAPFSARFDRLVQDGDRWTILDWKTGQISPKGLGTSWQTRLYPFALVEAGHVLNGGEAIAPERVRMIYWEVASGRAFPFDYDARRHDSTRRELAALANTLMQDFDPSLPDDPRFPRKTEHCGVCAYEALCHARSRSLGEPPTLPLPRFEETR